MRRERGWNEDAARLQLLKFFEAWGFADPATVAARRRLSALLFSLMAAFHPSVEDLPGSVPDLPARRRAAAAARPAAAELSSSRATSTMVEDALGAGRMLAHDPTGGLRADDRRPVRISTQSAASGACRRSARPTTAACSLRLPA